MRAFAGRLYYGSVNTILVVHELRLPRGGYTQDTIMGDEVVTTSVMTSKECVIFGWGADHGQGAGIIRKAGL